VGDDYGHPWNSPFAVRFPEGAPPSTVSVMSSQYGATFPPGTPGDMVVAVHPTQLYETALGFLMFLILWRMRKHTHREGWLFGVWCVLAGVERFIIEFFRAKNDQTTAGLTSAQIIAIMVCLVGVGLLLSRRGGDKGGPVAARA
jgi:phosphatidylglycerol:prolipoprotein diacylglycerol transferase